MAAQRPKPQLSVFAERELGAVGREGKTSCPVGRSRGAFPRQGGEPSWPGRRPSWSKGWEWGTCQLWMENSPRSREAGLWGIRGR